MRKNPDALVTSESQYTVTAEKMIYCPVWGRMCIDRLHLRILRTVINILAIHTRASKTPYYVTLKGVSALKIVIFIWFFC